MTALPRSRSRWRTSCRDAASVARLVDASVAWAHEAGIDRLSATMLSDNVAIRRLLTGLGIPARVTAEGFGVDAVTLDLSADLRRAA